MNLSSHGLAITPPVIGIGTLVCYVTATHWSHLRPGEAASFDPVGRSLGGFYACVGPLIVSGKRVSSW